MNAIAGGKHVSSRRQCVFPAGGGAQKAPPPSGAATPALPVFMHSFGECAFYTPLALRGQLQNAFHGRMILPSG
jgi:hypothetical protein